ncbi:F-box and WD repeat domain containing protein 10B isoform X2 [Hemicordylus capensis]|uniref:F-box and WD repeat domain containing protein 10B isoform X2 n=1 Tax=Hemicordylus capensis TaxID=884348 RepID=UPI002304BC16|nr:F-box and WD repeat domain containing protein 10B isoform X2 [Hemicordylus capensis]
MALPAERSLSANNQTALFAFYFLLICLPKSKCCSVDMCDMQLLHMAASLIRILLIPKEKIKKVKTDKLLQNNHLESGSSLMKPKSLSAVVSSVFEIRLPVDKSSIFDYPEMEKVWSKDTHPLSGNEEESSHCSVELNDSTSFLKAPTVNCIDFISCLPIHLSKYILGMLDHKSLIRCLYVSPYWAFLVKQIKKDKTAYRSLQNEIALLQGSCPKRAMANYARTVKVAIPQISKDGDIILSRRQSKQHIQEIEYMHKAYHGQLTDTINLEERNVLCSSYNIRVLLDTMDQNRVIHYSGGKLLAVGSADRKIHLLHLSEQKEVLPLIRGHAGSIRAIWLNEQKGFILSGSYDLSIRMWNIITGVCIKIFNGHSGTINCLHLHKNKFVSGAKDCMVKMWDIESGKCLKTLKHKGTVWAAKMNGTHIVSADDKGQVKVWHAGTCELIKSLGGHLGPVRCLSFDEWHLVTGSNDGYILGWSMVGNHKRCLMAFRHPKEVLYLEFLYLRVISGCADGKIRIFNFLTGTCLRVMRANSRGDPVVSFCVVENRLLINAKGSVVLFQFDEVQWDYTHSTERLMQRKEKGKSDDPPFIIKPSPHSHSERQKRAKKKNWKLYRTEDVQKHAMIPYVTRRSTRGSTATPALRYEMVQEPPPRTSQNMRTSLDLRPSERQKLSFLFRRKEQKIDSDAEKGDSDDESGYESPSSASSFGQTSETFVNYIKKKPFDAITNDQILLSVSTIHHAYKMDQVSVNTAYNMKIKDAWGPLHIQQDQPKMIQASQSPKHQQTNPSTQLTQLKTVGGTLGMERLSAPYETKTLQLNLKNSLLGDNVTSFIPAPTLTRSKSCSSLSGEKNIQTCKTKIPSPPKSGRQLVGLFTTSTESLKAPRMKIAQPDIEARRTKLFFAHTPNPYRLNSGFKLLTTHQMKEYEEAKVTEYQVNKTKDRANRQKECKNAWLRKIKGLPIDDFTKEGKVFAPELGENVYI